MYKYHRISCACRCACVAGFPNPWAPGPVLTEALWVAAGVAGTVAPADMLRCLAARRLYLAAVWAERGDRLPCPAAQAPDLAVLAEQRGKLLCPAACRVLQVAAARAAARGSWQSPAAGKQIPSVRMAEFEFPAGQAVEVVVLLERFPADLQAGHTAAGWQTVWVILPAAGLAPEPAACAVLRGWPHGADSPCTYGMHSILRRPICQ